MTVEPEIRILGDRVEVRQGRKTLQQAPLAAVLAAVAATAQHAPSCGIVPQGVRLWYERRDAVAVAIEIPARARTVRWLSDRSPAPYGRRARYEECFLGFPFMVILIVLRRGELTGVQQLYYRREPLDAGENLLLPNLCNVAQGYGLRCWLCLQNLQPLVRLTWPQKVAAIAEHVFSAAFNESSERHEGNSFWTSHPPVDPRVATLGAWREATRKNAWFALELPWRPAGTTASVELASMLDRVVAPSRVHTAADLWSLISTAKRGERGR